MGNLESKILGAMIGMALGDAIGELAYRFPRRAHLFKHIDELKGLTYTGDTAMALALADSLTQVGDIDTSHLGNTIREHYYRQPNRCFGPGLPRILNAVEQQGISFLEAAKQMYKGQGSLGNGAAMRVPPVGLMFHSAQDLYVKAEQSAAVTHSHPVGTDGAAIMAKAVAQSLESNGNGIDPVTFSEALATFAQTREINGKMLRVAELIAEEEIPVKAAHQLGRSITVHESMPFALFCFLRHSDDYVEALFTSISNGGDCNTLGAMTGAMCGAYVGIDGIPQPWIDKIENMELLESLSMQLADTTKETLLVAQA